MEKLYFACDYMEGAHPDVMAALNKTNFISVPGYGEDEFCIEAKQNILKECGCLGGEVYFLVGGTQTNEIIIKSFLMDYQGVIAADTGHISVHEAGAIERGGHKVITAKSTDGKISADQIEKIISDYEKDPSRDHLVMPGMVYLSQPTEYGTLYSKAELTQISTVCRANNILLYVDGARLAYALAAGENDVTLKDMASLADAFYIGGTKCGLLFGEAVVFPKKNTIPHFFTIMKQNGALLAKGRLLGVQFNELFRDGLYYRIGKDAIEYANMIKKKLVDCGYTIPIYSPTNQTFFAADNDLAERLIENGGVSCFERIDDNTVCLRAVTGWATTLDCINKLLEVLEQEK